MSSVAETRALLQGHLQAMRRVYMQPGICPTIKAQARRKLVMLENDLSQPILPSSRGSYSLAGKWGENGYAPAVRDIVAQAEFDKSSRAYVDLACGNSEPEVRA